MTARALDLFCGAGGASTGLHRAGFEVVGIDIMPQPRYPFTFVRGDALMPPVGLDRFDLIWASPPCQAFSSAAGYMRGTGRVYPDLIAAVRALLADTDAATIMENVPQAPIRADAVLDGTMFPDLKVIRRRHFELNFPAPFRLGWNATGMIHRGWSTVCGGGRPSGVPVAGNAWHTADALRAAMGIDWMTRRELSQAIPPAYAEFLGRAALAWLRAGRGVAA